VTLIGRFATLPSLIPSALEVLGTIKHGRIKLRKVTQILQTGHTHRFRRDITAPAREKSPIKLPRSFFFFFFLPLEDEVEPVLDVLPNSFCAPVGSIVLIDPH